MLQAMNTGHDGCMCTVHANTTRDALTRIENMVQMGSIGLPTRAIRTQIAGAVDLIVQVERQRDGVRRVVQVTEVCGLEGDVVTLNDVFQLEHEGEDQEGRLARALEGQPRPARLHAAPRLFRPGTRLGRGAGGGGAVKGLLLAGGRVAGARPAGRARPRRAAAAGPAAGARRRGGRAALAGRPRRAAAAELAAGCGGSALAGPPRRDLRRCGWTAWRNTPCAGGSSRWSPCRRRAPRRAWRRCWAATCCCWPRRLFWFLFCRWAFGWLDTRRIETLFRQFPDALGMVTRAVRVGIPVSEAIRSVAREGPKETAAEFQRIADRLSIGLPIDQALAETAHRNGVPEYRFFATALALQSQTGGGLGETLENLAEVIRKRVALKERGYALAAEARTSAGILAALPFFTAGVLAVLSPGYVAMLFTDPSGQRVLAAAIGLLLIGILVMRSMIKRSLS